MADMKEFWGIMRVLDSADDVALFIVSARDQKLLYCNHLVTMLTNAHTGSDLSKVWDPEDYRKAVSACTGSGAYRYIVEHSAFGMRKNVTVSKVVWNQGIQAHSFLLTSHVEEEEVRERDRIFQLLGQSYLHIFMLDLRKGKVTALLNKPLTENEGNFQAIYYHPINFDDWKKQFTDNLSHPDDRTLISDYLEPGMILDGLSKGSYSFQYRHRTVDSYRWHELSFRQLDGMDGRITCTERDVDGEITLNEHDRRNEVILRSIYNIFRSVYLLDLDTGVYTTVKPDRMLFGIPGEGDYDVLTSIVGELIPDEGQKHDYFRIFSVEALKEAFGNESVENVAREYASNLSEEIGWTSVTAFRPPYMQGMEGKCVLTFMDVTTRKQVEADRDEKRMLLDALLSGYKAVFFSDTQKGLYHSLAVPSEFRYIEKQYRDMQEAIRHYARAYVLEEYRDTFLHLLSPEQLDKLVKEGLKRELIYRSVSDQWIRLNIISLSSGEESREAILVFEEYGEFMGEYK